MRDFNKWIGKFRESIADYKYYVDFSSVYAHIRKYEKEIKMLDSLIGSQKIESDFLKLVKENPDVMKCIPSMLAKRENVIFCTDDDGGTIKYDFDSMNQSIDQFLTFMNKTGLFDLFKNRLIGSLSDYLIGVEAGLNSNARKNRGGHLMEDLVEKFIIDAGYVKDKTYFKEMYLSDLEKLTGLNLNKLSNNGTVSKRFDFVIINKKCVYACECNFYASGGSKLNETARSYKTLALESKGIKGFKFVWFTDGTGWLSAKNNLKETFDVLDDIYNIDDLENGIIRKF